MSTVTTTAPVATPTPAVVHPQVVDFAHQFHLRQQDFFAQREAQLQSEITSLQAQLAHIQAQATAEGAVQVTAVASGVVPATVAVLAA